MMLCTFRKIENLMKQKASKNRALRLVNFLACKVMLNNFQVKYHYEPFISTK